MQNSPDAVPLSLGAEDLAKSLVCMVLAGPLLTGYTQTINDWYDREIDAINEPYRPIPSGRITEGQVRTLLPMCVCVCCVLMKGSSRRKWKQQPRAVFPSSFDL